MSSLYLVVTVLIVCMSSSVRSTYFRSYNNGHLPACGEGRFFFRDFMKCDASLHYCFEYRNASCVGPFNWECVHNLNRQAEVDGSETDTFRKNAGFGNTRCCGGKYQSPIDIPASDAKCIGLLPTPAYINPDHPLTGTFENTGYYPKFFVEAEEYHVPLVLTGAPFTCAVYGSSRYVFTNIHIHSGIRAAHGSAHFLQGKAYDAEFHIVHVRENFWEPGEIDTRCASQTPLGLVVIGVFLSRTEGQPNAELNKLLSHDNLEKIKESNANCDYDDICDPDDDNNNNGVVDNDFFGDDDYCEDIDDDNDDNGADVDINDIFGGGDDLWAENGDFGLDRKKRRAERVRRDREGREREGRDREGREREGRWNGDRDENEGNRKVVCFCRRRGFEELFLRWARSGEEYECRLKYEYGQSSLLHEDQPAHVECNQHANGEPCGDHSEGIVEDFTLRPGLLLPNNREYYQYFGSLTTPPCSEVVNWMMMKEPIRITQAQLDNLHLLESRREDVLISKYGDVRPIQPVNGRTIVSSNC